MHQMHLTLRLYNNNEMMEETVCTALSLNREIYTPYNELSATFLADGEDYIWVNRISVLWEGTQIFMGIADRVEQFWKNGKKCIKVRSRSFTALMLQSEIEKGLYPDMTIGKLIENFCQIPFVTYEQDNRTGYIFVKEKTSLWDCVASFGYKLTHHYPYVSDNKIHLSPPSSAKLYQIPADQVLEYGTVYDSTKLISHYHMDNIEGTSGFYWLNVGSAIEMNITRHKWLSLDRQFLYDPFDALSYRSLVSKRGWRAKYITYEGFANEELGERVSFRDVLQNRVICRVLLTFGQNGVRTKIWTYEDGFYSK